MFTCQCCRCRHSEGADGCSATEVAQEWIESWSDRGVDHGLALRLCPPPTEPPCPGYAESDAPLRLEWTVFDGEGPLGVVYARSREEALEIVHEIDGEDPDLHVRVELSLV